MEIGSKIKEIRLKNQLTQEELADRCELSKGYISQLENDLTSPSIATLMDILQSLGTTLAEFFADDDDEKIVFSESEQFEKKSENNTIRWLVPTAQKNAMEPILITIEAGGASEPDLPHEGEEFGFVLDGAVTVCVGKKKVKAKKGDTFYFRSSKTHKIENAGGETAKIVWISCPPNF